MGTKSTGIKNNSRIATKNLIADLNDKNSGIVDSLCRSVSSIIRNDLLQEENHGCEMMDNRLLESMTDVIVDIQPNFVQSILLDNTLHQQTRVWVQLILHLIKKKVALGLTVLFKKDITKSCRILC